MGDPRDKNRAPYAHINRFERWALSLIEASYHSPVKLIVIIALSVFIIEALIMVFLFTLTDISEFTGILLDPVLMVLFLSPILYFFIFRPLLRLMDELNLYGSELKSERDKMHSYLEVAGVMILVLDRGGKVVLINRKGCEILGYGEQEIIGRDWFKDFVPERGRKEVWRLLTDLVSERTDLGVYFENQVITKGGTERTILWHNALLKENGTVAGILSSGEDITERKRVEKALKESENRYRLIHNTVFDGIIITDSTDTVVDVNPCAEKMFGYETGELIGVRLTEIMPEGYRERHNAGVKRYLETGISTIQGKVTEVEGLKKNGEVFPMELVVSNFSIAGSVYFTGTIRDITERKRAEYEKELIQARLSQSQKMEAIGRFAGGIAHDFNNILTAIRGNAELALEGVEGSSPLHTRLDGIVLSVLHASKLTRQLLLFSRGQPFELQPLSINGVIENMLKMVSRIIGEGFTVSTDLSPGLWPVRADEGSIEQVIMNLAVNARDAMPGGGTLSIKTGNLVLTEEDCMGLPDSSPGRAVCITVADTGMGIKKDYINRIFEPFFTTKESGKGTGVGLAMVYGVIKQHGGWITVQSEPNEGTVFRIYLPAMDEKAAERQPEPPGKKTGGRGERILLVEDEKDIREFSRTVLIENGYVVFTAATARAAAQLLEKENWEIDLVISDAVLPDRHGSQFLDSVISARPGIAALLSGSLADVRAGGASGKKKYRYLQKPYSLAGLLRAVTVSLESRQNKTPTTSTPP
jgi:PAS domain S-box-containing protein